MIFLLTVAASAVGALVRLVVDSVIKHRWPTQMPWATIIINVTGSALIGLLAGLVLLHHAPIAVQAIGGTGFCGGYTTFSSAGFETVRLIQQRARGSALVNAVGSLVGSALACACCLAAVGAA